jgi:hypothetical protein
MQSYLEEVMPGYKPGMPKLEYDLTFYKPGINGYYTGNSGFVMNYFDTFNAWPPGQLHPRMVANMIDYGLPEWNQNELYEIDLRLLQKEKRGETPPEVNAEAVMERVGLGTD